MHQALVACSSVRTPPAGGAHPAAAALSSCRAIAARRSQVHYVDCAIKLMLRTDGNINKYFMPDAVHPDADGCKWTQCAMCCVLLF